MRYAIGDSVALALVAATIGFSFGCVFGGIAGYAQGGLVDKMYLTPPSHMTPVHPGGITRRDVPDLGKLS
jgi:ABC-type dipeptide/oligopeptide/nickel transport system permease subunit